MPNLSNNSLAIRSSPHSGFSLAILRISARSACGMGGRPGRDFSRQNNRQPARCQRSKVAGFTTTKAPRQGNSFDTTTKLTPQENILGANRRSRTEQQHQPLEAVLDQTKCDPGEGDHALIVPQQSILGRQAELPSRSQFLRSTLAPPPASGHHLPAGVFMCAKPVLGGLHHEYSFARMRASV
jgi:hypothetical protein